MTDREPIRSYQRIFRPERRLHHVEGRTLPVPGGVPLRWLGYAGASLLSVLGLGARSLTLDLAISGGAAVAGGLAGGRRGAAIAGAGALAASSAAGFALELLDWPLRYVVIPAALASAATQATPDGRRADRFALSWLALRLAPRRRSLGRGLPAAGRPLISAAALRVAPDEGASALRGARVRGEGVLVFARPVGVRRARLRRRRLIVREAGGRSRRGELRTGRLALGSGETAEIRP